MNTKQQQAHNQKVRDTARSIATAVAAIPSPVTNEEVLQVLRDQKCPAQVLCEAFWMLDNSTIRFEHYERWHPRLRALRNTPTDGERMFALFS